MRSTRKYIFFFNLEKYIQQYGEIHSAILRTKLANCENTKFEKSQMRSIHFFNLKKLQFSIWENTKLHFFNLEKYIYQFGKIPKVSYESPKGGPAFRRGAGHKCRENVTQIVFKNIRTHVESSLNANIIG